MGNKLNLLRLTLVTKLGGFIVGYDTGLIAM